MSTGDRRTLLEYQRDRLLEAMEGEVEVKDLPALSRELRQVTAELDATEAPVGSDLDDELERQRQNRLARPEAAGS